MSTLDGVFDNALCFANEHGFGAEQAEAYAVEERVLSWAIDQLGNHRSHPLVRHKLRELLGTRRALRVEAGWDE